MTSQKSHCRLYLARMPVKQRFEAATHNAGDLATPELDPGARSVLGRAFSILNACAEADAGLTLAQIARTCGLPKSSAHRLVAQLVDVGGLERDGDLFGLGGQMFVLGSCAPWARHLRELASPFLEELYERTHETVHLGVLDGLHVLYVDKLCGRRLAPAAVRTRVGSRMPLVSTGLGKAILATGPQQLIDDVLANGWERATSATIASAERLLHELDVVRHHGVAFDHEESHVGVSCVAAPLDVAGVAGPAAISLTAPTDRFRSDAYARVTLICARAISRALRQRGGT